MTDQTPIERGAEALWNRMLDGLPGTARGEWRPWDNEAPGAINWHQDAQAVFDSIDTNQLAKVISEQEEYPHPRGYLSHAHAVKNWLTGNH